MRQHKGIEDVFIAQRKYIKQLEEIVLRVKNSKVFVGAITQEMINDVVRKMERGQ